MIAPMVLAALLERCAPQVDVRTAAAVVQVESGGREFAVNDNTTGRSYFPPDRASANALLARLGRDQVAIGIAQLDSVNFARFGVDAVAALEPCTNLRLGSQVLVENYRREYPRAAGATEEERRQVALRRAFSAYNSGSPTGAPTYAGLVVAATSSRLVRETTAIADGRGSRATVRVAHSAAPKPRKPLRVAHGPARAASAVFAGGASRIVGAAFVVEAAR